MKKIYSSGSFLLALFFLLFLPAAAGCSDDNDPEINTVTAGLQQVVSDLDEITARLRSTEDGSAATTAKIGVLEAALNNIKADIAALSTNGEASAGHLGIILGKLQGLQFGAADIDRTVTNLHRLIAGIAGTSADDTPGQPTVVDINKVVNYISKISELELQSLILTRFLEHGSDEAARREMEARVRAGFQGDMDTLEVHIKKMTDASINQMNSDFEPVIYQLQSARYIVLESVIRVENTVPALSQTLSLLTGRIADLDKRLTREQIVSIVESTANETLQANGITPDRLNELAAKIAEFDPLLVTLNALLPGVDTLITEIALLKTKPTFPVELAFSDSTFVSLFLGYPLEGYQVDIRPTTFAFPPPPYTATVFFKYEQPFLIPKITAEMIVQVKPATAPFDKSMIRLIDKQGIAAINEIIEITDVTPYADLNTNTHATTNTGLYVVSFRLKPTFTVAKIRKIALIDPTFPYDKINYDKITTTGTNQVRFALIAQTNGIVANRPVMSNFDIIITGRTNLRDNWFVGQTYVALDAVRLKGHSPIPRALNFFITSQGRREVDRNIKSSVDALRQEYVWNFEAYNGYYDWTNNYMEKPSPDSSDNNRRHAAAFDVPADESFQVNLHSMVKDNSFSNINNAYGYYIALDTPQVVPVAIDDFEGIGKAYTIGETGTVKRIRNRVKGEVGFRIWAVNYDGTLVDPDGRGFVIKYR